MENEKMIEEAEEEAMSQWLAEELERALQEYFG